MSTLNFMLSWAEHEKKFLTQGSTLTLSLLAVTWHLLITFANSLDPDLEQQMSDPNLFDTLTLFNSVSEGTFWKISFKKIQQTTVNWKITQHAMS